MTGLTISTFGDPHDVTFAAVCIHVVYITVESRVQANVNEHFYPPMCVFSNNNAQTS